MSSKRYAVAALGLFLAAGFVVAAGSDRPDPSAEGRLNSKETVAKVEPKKPHKAPIDPGVFRPYTVENGWASTVKKYGPRLAELQTYREKAAEVVSRNPLCSKVELSEISDRGSLNNMHFWVQCPGSDFAGTRFRFTEEQLRATNVKVVSEADKVMGEAQATERCEQMIAQKATHPSTVGINPFGTGYQAFPANENARVDMQFSAKNAFGMKLKYNARCTFTSAGQGEVRIWERQS